MRLNNRHDCSQTTSSNPIAIEQILIKQTFLPISRLRLELGVLRLSGSYSYTLCLQKIANLQIDLIFGSILTTLEASNFFWKKNQLDPKKHINLLRGSKQVKNTNKLCCYVFVSRSRKLASNSLIVNYPQYRSYQYITV